MATFKKYLPQNEKELHLLIEDNIENLEEGMNVVQREYSVSSGFLDFLCIDSGGRLVIIEVKLFQDDNMLFQSLRYYVSIEKLRYKIPINMKDFNIDPSLPPRILLIAQNFSEDLKTFASLMIPDIELFKYTAIIDEKQRTGIVFESVSLMSIDHSLPSGPSTIEKLISYNTNSVLHTEFEKMRESIKLIGNEIEEYATTSYVGYKYKGRQFAWIRPFRKSVEIGAHVIDETKQLNDYLGIRVVSGENYSEILEQAKISYSNLKNG